MRRLKRLTYYLIYFILTSCSTAVEHRAFIKIDRPNILFILVDDLGWADLGYQGSTFYETPNIDTFAKESMIFSNSYAASPICSPSRAAILSGKYPARLNLTDYIPGNRHWGPHRDQKLASTPFKLQLDLEEHTMAEAFKAAGYNTLFTGKWHVGEEEKFYPEYQGFDLNIAGNRTGHPSGGYFSPYNNPQIEDGYEGEYLTDRLTDEVISFIKEKRGNPFFAYLSLYTVHLPMQGKPDKVERYQEKLDSMHLSTEEFNREGVTLFKSRQNMTQYAAMVESMDENVGKLLKVLKQLKLDKNTIVIFTSDNGGMATSNQTENIPTTNLPLRAGKGHLYEGGVRTPLLIRYPQFKDNKVIETPVIGTDLYPTLLSMANLKPETNQHLDGVDLKPFWQGEEIDERPLFWHYPHYSGGLGGTPSGAVRLGCYKLIEFYENMHVELYNINRDISEQHNLATEHPEKVDELKEMLHRWRDEIEASMPYVNPHYGT